MDLAGCGKEVKMSVTQKENSKGICMEKCPEKYHFLLFPRPRSQLIPQPRRRSASSHSVLLK